MEGEETKNAGGSIGSLVGIIIILAVILLGGLYFWSQRKESGNENQNATTTTAALNVSASDETANIEADLEATDIDNLDAELDAS